MSVGKVCMKYGSFKTEEEFKNKVIDSALRHVIFDGWSANTFDKVCSEKVFSSGEVWQMFPRGGIDLALAFHERDNKKFELSFLDQSENDHNKKTRDRIKSAINLRLKIASMNREAVKRSIALFSTPMYFVDGSRTLWNTADLIWNLIGDSSTDINWYSKRLILSSIYSGALVIWMDDESPDFIDTQEFVSRRINDVMAFEKIKSKIRSIPILEEVVKKFEDKSQDFFTLKQKFPGWKQKQ